VSTQRSLPSPEQPLIVATSGGKDSTAMALWLRFESGLKNEMHFVFCDTQFEHSFTVEHLERLEAKLEAKIIRVGNPLGFLGLAKKKGRFPSARARFCTEHLKVKPMAEWLKGQEYDAEHVVCQGIRADESVYRSGLAEWDLNETGRTNWYDTELWRPILRWTPDDVFACHKRHDFEPNELYLRGQKRVGCFPCIMSTTGTLKTSFLLDPNLLDRLKEMEAEVGAANPRGIATFFRPDRVPERFHDAVDPKTGKSICTAQAVYDYLMGTDTIDMFDHSDVPTCMSQYGLCE